MGPCLTCGTTVAFGGVKDQGFRFCNKQCHQVKARFIGELAAVSDASAKAEAERIRAGCCPGCGKYGGIELHESIFIWSAILITRTRERRFVGCATCARHEQIKDSLGTLFLGWWGIPVGIVMTPVGIIVNVARMITAGRDRPVSKALTRYAREGLARQAAREAATYRR